MNLSLHVLDCFVRGPSINDVIILRGEGSKIVNTKLMTHSSKKGLRGRGRNQIVIYGRPLFPRGIDEITQLFKLSKLRAIYTHPRLCPNLSSFP